MTGEPLFEDDQYVMFANAVRTQGVGRAIETLRLFRVDEAVIEAIQAEHDRRCNAVRIGYPPQIFAVPGEPWYGGPNDGDVHWPALRSLLADQMGWPEERMDLLDQASSKVVAFTTDPSKPKYSCKGLVIGYVQSGKTTNYTAVVAKAADQGYNLVIVLSGIHNGLRKQTQARLDHQLHEQNPNHWCTQTAESHDFRKPANTLGSQLAGDVSVVSCIVKKNAHVLRKLVTWLEAAAHDGTISQVKALVIDDESDQASVETGTINPLIRRMLGALPRHTYIGYTATPFANVLIDPSADDLYPRNFILNLPRPEGYFGTEQIFGRDEIEDDPEDSSPLDGYDMVRGIPEYSADTFRYRRNQPYEPALTNELRDAIVWFLIATAIRRFRGDLGHSSMLIHTSMQTAAHEGLRDVVLEYLDRCASDMETAGSAVLDEFEQVFDSEIDRVDPPGVRQRPSFQQLVPILPEVLENCRLVLDNSRSQDRLEYGDEPITAIAIGGNTLSRGLTLEGLVVSFFVRAAKAYDTLLQMGRWFGYRPGYEDLPRIWVTDELNRWFRHLATVEREIRTEVDRYDHTQSTPTDFGVRIRTHPSLLVTTKMGAAVQAYTSYGGRRVQSRFFKSNDQEWLRQNRRATELLLSSAAGQKATVTPGATVFRSVPVSHILRFLGEYQSHEDSPDLDPRLIRRYVEKQVEKQSLLEWNVAVLEGPSDSNGTVDLGGRTYNRVVRSKLRDSTDDRADIKTLMSKEHRVIDLAIDPDEARAKTEEQLVTLRNADPSVSKVGLLVIYPIDPNSAPAKGRERTRTALDARDEVIGIGLIFPGLKDDAVGSEYIQVDLSALEVEEKSDENDDIRLLNEEDPEETEGGNQ